MKGNTKLRKQIGNWCSISAHPTAICVRLQDKWFQNRRFIKGCCRSASKCGRADATTTAQGKTFQARHSCTICAYYAEQLQISACSASSISFSLHVSPRAGWSTCSPHPYTKVALPLLHIFEKGLYLLCKRRRALHCVSLLMMASNWMRDVNAPHLTSAT